MPLWVAPDWGEDSGIFLGGDTMGVLRKWLGIGASICAGTLISVSATASPKTQNWRIQTLWQPGTLTQQAFERFAANVEDKTDGEIKVTPLAAGAAVGGNATSADMRHVVLQGQHPATVYCIGRHPALAVRADLSAAYDAPRDAEEYFREHGGLELRRETYKPHGLVPIGLVWWGSET